MTISSGDCGDDIDDHCIDPLTKKGLHAILIWCRGQNIQ